MWFLFESGIFIANIALKKRIEEREAAEAEAENEDTETDPDAELDKAVKEETELNKHDPL
jgi:hypothetical protein